MVGDQLRHVFASEVVRVILRRLAGRGKNHYDLFDCVHDGGAVGFNQLLQGWGELEAIRKFSQHDAKIFGVLLFVCRSVESAVE